jgi:hypothetical protein
MGKWKCIWCSKILEGESFMDLVAASVKEERGGQHVHGWDTSLDKNAEEYILEKPYYIYH